MYPKYLNLYLENLQILTNKYLETLYLNENNENLLKIFMIIFNLMKKKFEEDMFSNENEKNTNDNYLLRASTIIHNICFFCCDQFNLRYSSPISQNIKQFIAASQNIFNECMKYFFEIGFNFPDSSKKLSAVANVFFPLIVLNPLVRNYKN